MTNLELLKKLKRINRNINAIVKTIELLKVCAYYRSVLEINMVSGFFQEKSLRGLVPAEETPLCLFSWDWSNSVQLALATQLY